MRSFQISSLTALVVGAVLAAAIPYEDDIIFGRAVGDKCSAKEGSGSCQSTSKCL